MDVLVIGGGVIGVCSAYYLLKEGFSVTLLDRGEIASGCSYGNAGLIVPGHTVPLAHPGVFPGGLRWLLDRSSPFFIKPTLDPTFLSWLWRFWKLCSLERAQLGSRVLLELGQASRRLLAALVAAENLECEYRERGLLQVFRTEKGLRAAVESFTQISGEQHAPEVLDGRGAQSLEPSLRPGLAGGLLHRIDATINPAGFVRGLSRFIDAQGVSLLLHTTLQDLQVSGGRVTRVVTSNGEFSPAFVVLAAGAWTEGIGRRIGLSIPVRPGKGYSLTYERPVEGPALPLLLGEDWIAVNPMEGRLRFAGTLELGGVDTHLDQKRLAAVAVSPSRYLELSRGMRLLETWSGLRPVTPDGLPIIGRPAGFSNLILATGHAMLGMTLGAVTGRLVADISCERSPTVDVAPLRLERFSPRG